MNHLYNSKFLVRPIPLENEHILSYLERLRIENGYSTINIICITIFDTRINLVDLVKGYFNKERFSNYTNLTIKEVENLCLNDEIYDISPQVNLCLLCFKNLNYIKKEWHAKNYICEKHQIPIVNRYLYCNALYNLNIIELKICNKCHKSIF